MLRVRIVPAMTAVTESLLTVPNRAAGSSSLRPAVAQIDRLDAATRAKSSWFNAEMYRRFQTGLPPDRLITELRAPAPHAASSAESYS
jgi:hypothetical protein